MTELTPNTSVWPTLVLLGPTASGKSDLAMHIARQYGAEILSVDSMQVYREMDIGTAKPDLAERRQVPHHGIDLVNPDQQFTTARFVELADRTITDAQRRDVPLIAVGGTPLYYKAVFQGLFEGPGEDVAVRERLRLLGTEQLYERLCEVDPAAAQRIHRNDIRRMVRALEVHELTGRPISSFQDAWEASEQRHPAVWVGLSWEREALNIRINARVRNMLEGGWLEEVRRLLERYGALSRTAAEATGYRELIEHLHGRISLDSAVENIKIATRQLARRQMKWFRRFDHVHWLDGTGDTKQLSEQVMALWRGDNRAK